MTVSSEFFFESGFLSITPAGSFDGDGLRAIWAVRSEQQAIRSSPREQTPLLTKGRLRRTAWFFVSRGKEPPRLAKPRYPSFVSMGVLLSSPTLPIRPDSIDPSIVINPKSKI